MPALVTRLSTEEEDKPYVDQKQDKFFEFLIDSPRIQPHKEHSDTITTEVYDTNTASQHHNHSCTTEPLQQSKTYSSFPRLTKFARRQVTPLEELVCVPANDTKRYKNLEVADLIRIKIYGKPKRQSIEALVRAGNETYPNATKVKQFRVKPITFNNSQI